MNEKCKLAISLVLALTLMLNLVSPTFAKQKTDDNEIGIHASIERIKAFIKVEEGKLAIKKEASKQLSDADYKLAESLVEKTNYMVNNGYITISPNLKATPTDKLPKGNNGSQNDSGTVTASAFKFQWLDGGWMLWMDETTTQKVIKTLALGGAIGGILPGIPGTVVAAIGGIGAAFLDFVDSVLGNNKGVTILKLNNIPLMVYPNG